MLRSGPLLAVCILLNSCNPDEVKLIRSYQVVWESNLMERYAQYEPLPPLTAFFRFIITNPNGSIYVIHSPENYSDNSTITLLGADGTFVNDITLTGEFIFGVAKNPQGYMQTLARSGDNYLIKTWDDNLNAATSKVLPVPGYFHQYFIRENFYYEIRFDADVGDFIISRYNLSGVPQWSRLFSGYKITGYATPVFFPHSDDFLLSRHNPSYDSFRIVKVVGRSGLSLWNRNFALSDLGAESALPAVFPDTDGQVLIFNKFDYRVQSRNGFTLFEGRLYNTSSIPESPVAAATKEPDNGYLIVTNYTPEEGWKGFRLLKTDSRFKVGWIGNFYQAVNGYFTGWARHNDTVVLLTSNGYVYAIRPAD